MGQWMKRNILISGFLLLAFFVCAVFSVVMFSKSNTSDESEYAIYFHKGDGMSEKMLSGKEGNFTRDYSDIRENMIKSEIIPFDFTELNFEADVTFDKDGNVYDICLYWTEDSSSATNKRLTVTISPNQIIASDVLWADGSETTVNKNGIEISGYEYENILTLSFMKDGIGYYLEGVNSDYGDMGYAMEQIIAHGVDLSYFKPNNIPAYSNYQMTFEDVKNDSVFENYIPTIIPTGYDFSEAWRLTYDGVETLDVYYADKNENYIKLSLSDKQKSGEDMTFNFNELTQQLLSEQLSQIDESTGYATTMYLSFESIWIILDISNVNSIDSQGLWNMLDSMNHENN